MKTFKSIIIGTVIILLFRIPIEMFYKKLDLVSILFGVFTAFVLNLVNQFLTKDN